MAGPGRVSRRRPWVWTLATAAIADGLPVSAETTAKVASLRARGLL